MSAKLPSLHEMIEAAVREADTDDQVEKTASDNTAQEEQGKEASTQQEGFTSAEITGLADELEKVAAELSSPDEDVEPNAYEKVLNKLSASANPPQAETNLDTVLKAKEPKKDAATAQPPMKPTVKATSNSKSKTALETDDTKPTENTKQKDNILKTSSEEKRDEVRNKILQKLGGEDVSPASISGKKNARNPEDEEPPSQPQQGDRALIASNEAATNYNKRQAKSTVKKVLKDVLDEPALSKAHDGKLHENLANAERAGVKLSHVREQLKKVAHQGCSCAQEGTCPYCELQTKLHNLQEKQAASKTKVAKLKKALRKNSFFSSTTGGASTASPVSS